MSGMYDPRVVAKGICSETWGQNACLHWLPSGSQCLIFSCAVMRPKNSASFGPAPSTLFSFELPVSPFATFPSGAPFSPLQPCHCPRNFRFYLFTFAIFHQQLRQFCCTTSSLIHWLTSGSYISGRQGPILVQHNRHRVILSSHSTTKLNLSSPLGHGFDEKAAAGARRIQTVVQAHRQVCLPERTQPGHRLVSN